MQALPVRQLPVEFRIPQRWPLVLMQELLEEPLTQVRGRLPRPLVIPQRLLPARTLPWPVIRVRLEIPLVLMRVRLARTLPSPVRVRRAILPVPMLELRVRLVRTPVSPGTRVLPVRFLERAQPVVRRVRPEAVGGAGPLNSK